jgi:hypothetical protein
MIAFTLMVFFIVGKKGAMGAPSNDTDGLVASRSGERKDLIVEQSRPEAVSVHSLGSPSAVPEFYERGGGRGNEFSLAGNTLRMYWSLLSRRNTSVGLRAIQREMGFSSPSSAVYQLDKLVKLGLVSKDEMGDYVVSRIVKVGFLREFLFLGRHALPKNAIYGALTLLVNIACYVLLVVMQVQILVVLLAVLPGLVSSSIFWHDAAKTLAYKKKLIGRSNSNRER